MKFRYTLSMMAVVLLTITSCKKKSSGEPEGPKQTRLIEYSIDGQAKVRFQYGANKKVSRASYLNDNGEEVEYEVFEYYPDSTLKLTYGYGGPAGYRREYKATDGKVSEEIYLSDKGDTISHYSFEYDIKGRLTKRVLLDENGKSKGYDLYSYFPGGWLKKVEKYSGGVFPLLLSSVEYAENKDGQQVQQYYEMLASMGRPVPNDLLTGRYTTSMIQKKFTGGVLTQHTILTFSDLEYEEGYQVAHKKNYKYQLPVKPNYVADYSFKYEKL